MRGQVDAGRGRRLVAATAGQHDGRGRDLGPRVVAVGGRERAADDRAAARPSLASAHASGATSTGAPSTVHAQRSRAGSPASRSTRPSHAHVSGAPGAPAVMLAPPGQRGALFRMTTCATPAGLAAPPSVTTPATRHVSPLVVASAGTRCPTMGAASAPRYHAHTTVPPLGSTRLATRSSAVVGALGAMRTRGAPPSGAEHLKHELGRGLGAVAIDRAQRERVHADDEVRRRDLDDAVEARRAREELALDR